MKLQRIALIACLPALCAVMQFQWQSASAGEPSWQLPWPTGQQHQITDGYTYGCGTHQGIDEFAVDFSLSLGQEVSAVASGTVTNRVQGSTGLGWYVEIAHAGGYKSAYGHLNGFGPGIVIGANVRTGQLVGYADHTGVVKGGNPDHLHLRVTLNGAAYKAEPMSWVQGFGNLGTHAPGCVVPPPSGYSELWVSKAPANEDYNGNGCADIMAREAGTGVMRMYPGPCAASIPGSWLNYGSLPTGSFNNLMGPGGFSADGCVDVITRKSSNQAMRLYPGASPPTCSAQGFDSASGIGQNWGAFNLLFSPRDFSGDGCADVMGRQSDQLYLSNGNATPDDCLGTSLTNAVLIGSSGWSAFNSIFSTGDFSGDGCSDVIARNPSLESGKLWMLIGNCSGGFGNGGSAIAIGNGWNTFNLLSGPGDYDNDGCTDIIARNGSNGTLWLYQGNCGIGGVWFKTGSGVQIGVSGWNIFDAIF